MTKAMDRPIGVFDSGLGGLTVFKALAERMPRESLIYFGDTAHVPYGSKSKEVVTRYSVEIARFLAERGVKAIVVACNTASALALPAIKKAVKVPVIGVVEAGAAAAKDARRIGVIGTEATIGSKAYEKALKRRLPSAKVVSVACPMFVPIVEEGWWDDAVTEQIAQRYLAPLRGAKVSSLILGCTHYPLLKETIQRVMGESVQLVDSAEATAEETDRQLTKLGLRGGDAARHYFVSDAPQRFLRLSQRFLGTNVKSVTQKTL